MNIINSSFENGWNEFINLRPITSYYVIYFKYTIYIHVFLTALSRENRDDERELLIQKEGGGAIFNVNACMTCVKNRHANYVSIGLTKIYETSKDVGLANI